MLFLIMLGWEMRVHPLDVHLVGGPDGSGVGCIEFLLALVLVVKCATLNALDVTIVEGLVNGNSLVRVEVSHLEEKTLDSSVE